MNAHIRPPKDGETFYDWLTDVDGALAKRMISGEESEGDDFRRGRLSVLHELYALRTKHGPDADLPYIVRRIEEALLARRREAIASTLVPRLLAGRGGTDEGATSGAQQAASRHQPPSISADASPA